MIVGENSEGWEVDEQVPPDVENFFYHLMLEVGAADAADEMRHLCRHLLHKYPAPMLAQMVLGMAAMAHDLWTEGMTAELIEAKKGSPLS